MSDTVIDVERLSKRYVLGRGREPGEGLRHAVERAVRSPLAWIRGAVHEARTAKEEFWALRDVSFTVARGDVVGIIGRNGAGKSTLLKVLSRITDPSEGRVRLRGRVASLLEVGTGFHPELTGRENVFLNGAILGMSRAELRRKFDAIAAFAEVERFLDTPVKRYSSGMQVRLAFAVAAHLDPEILIVDEVLAVGDSAFQKKCLGRMRHVASEEGRTVLFVSHNTGALSGLCSRGVLLEEGRLSVDADIHTALAAYLKTTTARRVTPAGALLRPRIDTVVLDEEAIQRGDLEVRIAFSSPFALDPPIGGVTISDADGRALMGSNTRMHPDGYVRRRARHGVLVCRIPHLPLHSGEYLLSAWLADMQQDYDAQLGVVTFHFASPDFRPEIPPASGIGPVSVRALWDLEEEDAVAALSR